MTPLHIDLIRIDGGTQPRAHLNPETVTEYANAMADDGCVFPPVTVFYDGADYWLADGFHRVAASKEAGFADIDADIRQGTRRDAVLFSVGANADHGLRRTNEDKRRAVLTLLNDSEWKDWPDREIARRCGVDHKTVGALRALTGELPQLDRTYKTKHGTVAIMRVGNIGRTREPREDVPVEHVIRKWEPSERPRVPGRVESTIGRRLPGEDEPTAREQVASVMLLDGLDRILAASECWPDPADALKRAATIPAFSAKLPIVAAWLAQLHQSWEDESVGEPSDRSEV